MDNTVAQELEMAIKSAPYQIEKDRYAKAAQEIRRLQAQLDEILGEEEDPQDWQKTSYAGSPWHADADQQTVRVFCEYAQVFKAPKKGTPYEEYWPNTDLLRWMLRVMNEAEQRGDHSPPAVLHKEAS